MSNIANLVAFDGNTTPASHTFVPLQIQKEKNRAMAMYRESLAHVPVYAQPRVTLYADAVTKNGVYRVGVLVEVPVMEAVNAQNAAGYTAAPKVAHIVTTRFELTAHERSDLIVRRLARQLTVNIGNGVATSVAPVTTGPVAELFDQLIMPT